MRLNSVKDLKVYKKPYELAMKIFHITKKFPDEEHRDLTATCEEIDRLGSMIKNTGPFLASDV